MKRFDFTGRHVQLLQVSPSIIIELLFSIWTRRRPATRMTGAKKTQGIHPGSPVRRPTLSANAVYRALGKWTRQVLDKNQSSRRVRS